MKRLNLRLPAVLIGCLVFGTGFLLAFAATPVNSGVGALESPLPKPAPIVVPTPRPGPFLDEQGDKITKEFVGVDEHGTILHARVKDKGKPAKTSTANETASVLADAPLTHKLYFPMVSTSVLYDKRVAVFAYIFSSNEYPDVDVPADPSTAVDQLTNQLINDLKKGSSWHGYAISSPAMLNFSVYSMTKLYELPPYGADGNFDYGSFYNRFNLCALVQAGLVDEVWVWSNQHGHLAESVVNGPTWSMSAGALPNCGRTVTTMGFSYFRNVTYALEAYGHSLEYMMQLYVPAGLEACDFRTQHFSMAIFAPPAECQGAYAISDLYGFTARAWDVNGYTGACGWTHQPPNQWRAVDYGDPLAQYRYGLTNTVQSLCADWQWDVDNSVSFNCYTYNCDPYPDPSDTYQTYVHNTHDEERFLIWWMQNFPGLDNDNLGRDGQVRPNWWTIKFK